jgi:hypothetical protein
MNEPRRIEVAYTDGHWLAEAAPDYDEPLDCGTLQKLIDAVQRDWPDEPLLFIVDRSTIDGYLDAESQFLDESEKSGAMVVSSMQL